MERVLQHPALNILQTAPPRSPEPARAGKARTTHDGQHSFAGTAPSGRHVELLALSGQPLPPEIKFFSGHAVAVHRLELQTHNPVATCARLFRAASGDETLRAASVAPLVRPPTTPHRDAPLRAVRSNAALRRGSEPQPKRPPSASTGTLPYRDGHRPSHRTLRHLPACAHRGVRARLDIPALRPLPDRPALPEVPAPPRQCLPRPRTRAPAP